MQYSGLLIVKSGKGDGHTMLHNKSFPQTTQYPLQSQFTELQSNTCLLATSCPNINADRLEAVQPYLIWKTTHATFYMKGLFAKTGKGKTKSKISHTILHALDISIFAIKLFSYDPLSDTFKLLQ